MSIFDKRTTLKPYEYPEVIEFQKAINKAYWLVTEYKFDGDIQDFKVNMTDRERSVAKNAMLAISQIEVAVKKFWTKLGDYLPKAEFDAVGVTFGESELRHLDGYSHLLKILDLEDEFGTLQDNPVIQGRVDYLTKYLKGAADGTQEGFTLSLALFSLFIENVSLFSQFLVIQSFYKHREMLKGIDNVVLATKVEERLHALCGVYLITKIREEFPEWFNEEFYAKLSRAARKAFTAECAIVDWMFSEGDLDFLTKNTVIEFIKCWFNDSLQMLGAEALFEVDAQEIEKVNWFIKEIHQSVKMDFFNKRPTNYTAGGQSVTADDLF